MSEVTREQDEAVSREIDAHAEALKSAIELGLCLKCGCESLHTELNPRNITFKCYITGCEWFAVYAIRTIGNSERAQRDESLDLIAIAEKDVLEKSKAWLQVWREGAPDPRKSETLADIECELLAAVTLLESREQMETERRAA